MEADHQKKAFQGSLWNSGWLSGGPKYQTQFKCFQNLFFLTFIWVIGWCHQHGESPQNAFLLWLASLVPSKQGAYLLPMCSTTQVQKWTKGWVSCSLWAAMIQTGCRVSRCSLRTLEMWHFQLQLHFSKKYIKCVKQATSNSESPRKVLSSCIILLKHDMRPSFLNCQISRPKILHRKRA